MYRCPECGRNVLDYKNCPIKNCIQEKKMSNVQKLSIEDLIRVIENSKKVENEIESFDEKVLINQIRDNLIEITQKMTVAKAHGIDIQFNVTYETQGKEYVLASFRATRVIIGE